MSLTSYRAAPPRVVHATASSSCWRVTFDVACRRVVCGVACVVSWLLGRRRVRCRLCACRRSARRCRVCAEGSEDLAATDFPAPWGAVSWALVVFTSEFGMGSGAAPPPWPPGRLSPRNVFVVGFPQRGASSSTAPFVVGWIGFWCRRIVFDVAWVRAAPWRCRSTALSPVARCDVDGCCAWWGGREPIGRLGPVS